MHHVKHLSWLTIYQTDDSVKMAACEDLKKDPAFFSQEQPLSDVATNLNPTKSPEEVLQALKDWLKKNDKPLDGTEGIIFTKIQPYNAHYYTLTTLAERRQESKACKAYNKYVLVDGECYGPSPSIWSMSVPTPTTFTNGCSEYVRKPHTDVVKSCTSCSGSGSPLFSNSACTLCNGTGCIVHFKQFQATFTVTKSDHVSYLPAGLSKENLLRSGGLVVLNEKNTSKVIPIAVHRLNDPEIVSYSKEAIAKFDGTRVLLQEQTVERFPVTIVEYKNAKKHGKFYLYGLEDEIFFSKSNVCVIS